MKDSEDFVCQSRKNWEAQTEIDLEIRLRDSFVGMCGFVRMDMEARRGEIGIVLYYN